MLKGLFARRESRPDPDRLAAEAVKAMARGLIAWPGTELTVSEIICLDPGCPGTETVILVMAAGRRSVAAKIPKPAREMMEPDVRSALVAAGVEVMG